MNSVSRAKPADTILPDPCPLAGLGSAEHSGTSFPSLTRLIHRPDKPAGVRGRFWHFGASLTKLVHRPDKPAGVCGRFWPLLPSLTKLVHRPDKPAGVCGRFWHFLPSLTKLVHRPDKPAGVLYPSSRPSFVRHSCRILQTSRHNRFPAKPELSPGNRPNCSETPRRSPAANAQYSLATRSERVPA